MRTLDSSCRASPGQVLHQPPELLAALLEVAELVVARAGRARAGRRRPGCASMRRAARLAEVAVVVAPAGSPRRARPRSRRSGGRCARSARSRRRAARSPRPCASRRGSGAPARPVGGERAQGGGDVRRLRVVHVADAVAPRRPARAGAARRETSRSASGDLPRRRRRAREPRPSRRRRSRGCARLGSAARRQRVVGRELDPFEAAEPRGTTFARARSKMRSFASR